MSPVVEDLSDTSAVGVGDVSARAPSDGCGWCSSRLEDTRQRYCSRKCRQTAFRLRRRRATDERNTEPGTFAYADPPYPGLSSKYYRDESTFAGEVDHHALIASLEAFGYTGWALSTSRDALRTLLPLCPPETVLCPWVKPIGVSSRTFGMHNTWEALLVVRGRALRPGKRDWLLAQPARFGGELMGRKPVAFCAFLFEALGMLPGDKLVDLFPGTGAVSRAWASLGAGGDASSRYRSDASSGDGGDVSSTPSAAPGGDASSRAARNAGGAR